MSKKKKDTLKQISENIRKMLPNCQEIPQKTEDVRVTGTQIKVDKGTNLKFIKIVEKPITEPEKRIYILQLKERVTNWRNCLGAYIKTSCSYIEGDEELVREIIETDDYEKLLDTLSVYNLIPKKIFHVEDDSGICQTLPIYTGIATETSESVIMEAFFSNEQHLINRHGQILHEEYHSDIEIGILDGQQILIRRFNDDYDTLVKGRAPEYLSQCIFYDDQYLGDSKIEFQTEVNIEYSLRNCFSYYNREFTGNGEVMVFHNLPLGNYIISSENLDKTNDDPLFSTNRYTHFEKTIGLFLDDVGDFTINYSSFPEYKDLFKYEKLLNDINASNTPKETALKIILESISDHSDCSLNQLEIYPYLAKDLRQDLDILQAVFIRFLHNKLNNRSLSNCDSHLGCLPATLSDLSLYIHNNDKKLPKLSLYSFPIELPGFKKDMSENMILCITNLFKNNINRIKELLFFFPSILTVANYNLLSETERLLICDNEEVLLMAANDYDIFSIASERLLNDRSFIKKMIQINSSNINRSRFKFDREMVMAALTSSQPNLDEDILHYFSSDKEIILMNCKKKFHHIENMSREFIEDKSIILELIDAGLTIRHMYNSEKNKDLFNKYLNDRELVKKMLMNNPANIDMVKEEFQTDRDILYSIIQKKGYGNFIKYGNHAIKNDKEIVELSVSDNIYNIQYAGEIILQDNDFLIGLINKHMYYYINIVSKEFQQKLEAKTKDLRIQRILLLGIMKLREELDKELNTNDDEDDLHLPF